MRYTITKGNLTLNGLYACSNYLFMSWPKTLTGMKAVQKRFTKAAMTKQLMLFSNRGTGTFWISNT